MVFNLLLRQSMKGGTINNNLAAFISRAQFKGRSQSLS